MYCICVFMTHSYCTVCVCVCICISWVYLSCSLVFNIFCNCREVNNPSVGGDNIFCISVLLRFNLSLYVFHAVKSTITDPLKTTMQLMLQEQIRLSGEDLNNLLYADTVFLFLLLSLLIQLTSPPGGQSAPLFILCPEGMMHLTPQGLKIMQFALLFNGIRLYAFILKTQFPTQQVRHVFLNKTVVLTAVFLLWHKCCFLFS